MSRRPVEVEVHDRHVDLVVNGKILMHSEDYDSVSNARRAARRIIDAIDSREMHLVEWRGRKGSMTRTVTVVRKLWQSGTKGPIALPKGHVGPISQPWNPTRKWFDSHLEAQGY